MTSCSLVYSLTLGHHVPPKRWWPPRRLQWNLHSHENVKSHSTVACRPSAGQGPRSKHVPVATFTHASGETGCCLRGPRRGVVKEENWGNQFSRALQGRQRRDGAIVELTVDRSSARAAVKIGPERGYFFAKLWCSRQNYRLYFLTCWNIRPTVCYVEGSKWEICLTKQNCCFVCR
jgi:hypothetical protein